MPAASPPHSPRRPARVSRRSLLILAALPVPASAAPEVPAPAVSAPAAAPAVPAPAAPAVPDGDPTAPIAALYAALERLMRTGADRPFAERFRQIAPVIDRVFDLADILTLSVGLRWNSLDDATRARLVKAFRDFTIATYVANFDSYEGERFEVLAGQRSVGADRVVATRIIQANGNPVRLDYVMRQLGPRWQVVDVLLDATISRVAVQRSDFRALLTNGGAAALIDSLQRKTADLSGGARLDP